MYLKFEMVKSYNAKASLKCLKNLAVAPKCLFRCRIVWKNVLHKNQPGYYQWRRSFT